MNWREAKGAEEINIYQSERRRRTIHSLPKESRVSKLTHKLTKGMACVNIALQKHNYNRSDVLVLVIYPSISFPSFSLCF